MKNLKNIFAIIRPSQSSAEKGQVLLIIVLVMVVALTVGLSVATRSITNLRTTTEEENSQRAFSAAEAGIERALKDPTFVGNVNKSLGNNASIKTIAVSNLNINGTALVLNNGTSLNKNEGSDVWFAPHNSDGSINYAQTWPINDIPGTSITIRWGGSTNGCSNAALELIFVSQDPATPGKFTTNHQLLDPCTSPRVTGNLTPHTNDTFGYSATGVLHHRVTYGNYKKLILLKVIPLYQNDVVAVSSNPALPPQGTSIDATGESGETFRKIHVNKPYPQIPPELFSVLFSPRNN